MPNYYDDSKVDRILNYMGMFNSLDEIKHEWKLSDNELKELRARAKSRYGKDI